MTNYTYNLDKEPVMWKSRMVENPNPPPDYIEEDYGIQPDVGTSDMTNKNIISCTWNGETKVLTIVWDGTLSTSDKAILDQIVVDNS